jgi:hypothetical protein
VLLLLRACAVPRCHTAPRCSIEWSWLWPWSWWACTCCSYLWGRVTMGRFLRWQLRVVGVKMHLRSATHNMALPPALERAQNTTPTHSPTRTIHTTDNKLTARPKHRTRSTPHSPCCMRTINLTSPCGSLHLDRCARWPVANCAHAAVRRVVR